MVNLKFDVVRVPLVLRKVVRVALLENSQVVLGFPLLAVELEVVGSGFGFIQNPVW